ncbi:hypothetical protein [Nocardia jejuensis]|uniref:hypothetical protein n=1 Tax=Nocardia jejuensis TaxID=328049 RepID=UPI00082EA680|nr:hypothetical protein [Nocardia jejuensis]
MTEQWDVLLIGGASGVGKSRAAAAVARRTGAFVVEFDDVVGALEVLTTPAQFPDLHHFDQDLDYSELSVQDVVRMLVDTAVALEPAVVGVVINRLTVPVRAVVEGDFLTPAVAARMAKEAAAQGRTVRSVFLHERDADRIMANYAEREPDTDEQRHRAETSALYSRWLAEEATSLGLPVVECRPWDTLPERIARAVD